MTTKLFTAPDTWTGGSFDLALDLGLRSDEHLRSALRAIWTHPGVQGLYEETDKEPDDQRRIALTDADFRLYYYYRGVCTLPNEKRIACGTTPVREEDEHGNAGIDWLYFSIPIGALAKVYPVGAYPFDDGLPLTWRDELNEWLRQMGEKIFQAVKFRLALIGWIGAAPPDADEIAQSGIPDARWEGYLWPQQGRLEWYPPNQGAVFGFGQRK